MPHHANVSSFVSAQPVWVSGRETEKNLTLGFRAFVNHSTSFNRVAVRLTASTLYRLCVNGEFAGYGPARAAHGFYRIDEWDITPLCREGQNIIAVEVAGYNVNSYYVLDQPSFLQAEVLADGEVLAATGRGEDFQVRVCDERVQRVQRYSFQRPFVEVYRLQSHVEAWKHDPNVQFTTVQAAVVETKKAMDRLVPYPRFATVSPTLEVASGTVTHVAVEHEWKDRSLTNIGQELGGYTETELEVALTRQVQELRNVELKTHQVVLAKDSLEVPTNSFRIFDFGVEKSGFIGLHVRCEQPVKLYVTFDEILTNGDVNFSRFECANAILWELQPGDYRLDSFESYSLRYAKVIAVDGACQLQQLYLREYANDAVYEAQFSSPNRELNFLFEAARETYRQNATDVFIDCPSRERAGWLCDSLFTARTAYDLSGNTVMEHMFLQNYALAPQLPHLPAGVLPSCYPADHNDGMFIPNWMFWFVLELGEYIKRSNDSELLEQLRPKVEGIFNYFSTLLNEDGLLENLKGWVFIEWSAANNFIHDVNYPSNMLYAAALEEAARLYDVSEWNEQAKSLRKTIVQQSYRDGFFYDNAVRENGKLVTTNNRTEVCQYYAFYFGLATPETYPELWQIVQERLGPTRRKPGDLDDVHPANALIGNVLRLELLSQQGLTLQIIEEYVPYWMRMAGVTGTLWEHDDTRASCNHGFASHAAHVLLRDVQGIREIDTHSKHVQLLFSDLDLVWCHSRLPVPEGFVDVQWWHENNQRHFKVQVPAGYTYSVENKLSIPLQLTA